jgi:hypothetical protein
VPVKEWLVGPLRDWVEALIAEGISEATIKSNVIVVQHSYWNESKTSAADLAYVQAKTTYIAIDDGNVDFGDTSRTERGADTPDFETSKTTWLPQATFESTNEYTKSLWTTAVGIIEASGFNASWSSITAGGVDFSDCVENWYIFGKTNEVRNIEDFWFRYVTGALPGPQFDTWIDAGDFSGESDPTDDTIVLKVGSGVENIKDGSTVYYENVNFGSGVSNFTLSASSDGVGGTVELRVGSETGPLLGSVEITDTGGWSDYAYFTTTFDPSVTGATNLYFVFKNTLSSDSLFNVGEFIFSNDDYSDGHGEPVNGSFQEENGVVVIDVESTPVVSGWAEETAISGYLGTSYYTSTLDSFSTAGQGVLEYSFVVANAGAYQLQWRSRITEGTSSTDFNDNYARLVDADGNAVVPIANDLVPTGAEYWHKIYMNTVGSWIWQASNHDNDPKAVAWNLTAGNIYRVQVSCRSKGHGIDRLVLWNRSSGVTYGDMTGRTSSSQNSALDALPLSSLAGPNLLTIKAVDFTNLNVSSVSYEVETAHDALMINAAETTYRDAFATASTPFAGRAGTYDITLTTLLETDGESPYEVLVNGVVVGSVTNSTTSTDYALENHVFSEITIPSGATISVRSKAVTNGLIPEGDGTAYSRGRWRQIEFSVPGVGPPVGTNGNILLIDMDPTTESRGNPTSFADWSDAGVIEDLSSGAAGAVFEEDGSVVNYLSGGVAFTRSSQTGYGGDTYSPANNMLNDYWHVKNGTDNVSITGLENVLTTGVFAGLNGNIFSLQANQEYRLYLFGSGDNNDQDAEFTFNGETKSTSASVVGTAADAGHYVTFDFTTPADVTGYSLDFSYANKSSEYAALNGLALVGLGGYESWADTRGIGVETNDFDDDGVNNLMEYALGGNPTNDDAAAISPSTFTAADGDTHWFYHVYNKRTDDPALHFILGATTNLVSTPAEPNEVAFVGQSAEAGGFRMQTNRTEAMSKAKFIQLKVEK